MSPFLILAAAGGLAAATPSAALHMPSRATRPGLIDVSAFNAKAMVRPVAAAPCVSDNFARRPGAGCLREAQHAPVKDAPRK